MAGLLRTPLTAALLATALVGCATGAKVRPADVQLPTAFEVARPGEGAVAIAEPWWSAFHDAQLDELIGQALTRAPDARTAMARLKEAMAIRSEALDSYNPQGALTAQASDQHLKSKYSGLNLSSLSSGSTGSSSGLSQLFLPANETKSYQGAFNVSWEIDLFGQRKAARRSANADLLAARFDYDASRLSLSANVATSLFQARALAVQLEDARETARITRDLASLGAKKAEHGLASQADSARLESDAATAEAEVQRLKQQSVAARRALLALLGRGAEPVESLFVKAEMAGPPAPPAATPGDILRRRPDVREAEQRVRSAIGQATLARLAQFPVFTLLPGTSLSRTDANYITTTSVWTLAAGATVPILDQPRLMSQVRLQKARAEEAVALYEQAVQNAYRDAENGLNLMAADRSRLDLLTKAEASAHFAFQSSQRGYDMGLIDLTTLLDAERGWRASRSALTNLQASALTDAVTTIKALGGGWSGSSAPVKG